MKIAPLPMIKTDIVRQLFIDHDTVKEFKEQEIGYKVFRVFDESISIIQSYEEEHNVQILWYDLEDPDISRHTYIVTKIRAKTPSVTYKGNEPEKYVEIMKRYGYGVYRDSNMLPRTYRSMCAVAESILDVNGNELDIDNEILDLILMGHVVNFNKDSYDKIIMFHQLIFPDFFSKDDNVISDYGINYCKTKEDIFIYLKGNCLLYIAE